MFSSVINIAYLLFFATVIYFVKDLPKLYRVLKVEQTRAANSQELQREAYFREIGGEDLVTIFKDWVAFLYDMDNKVEDFDADSAIDLISRTVTYGSTRTIHLCSSYMRDLHTGLLDSSTNDDELDYSGAKTLLYIAYIVSSLKFDFTGYEVDPLKLLQMKISDFSEIKKTEPFKKALEDIKREDIRM
nr:MAG TPA: hypothetical protein [Caudoviricetes sp.]